jgi:hypothetical protein
VPRLHDVMFAYALCLEDAKAKVFLSLLMLSTPFLRRMLAPKHTLTRRALCRFAAACRSSLGL